jgi:hypothetical protein
MQSRPSVIERAFQLARSGTCASLTDIRMRLQSENYADAQIHTSGHSIARQLRGLIVAAQAPHALADMKAGIAAASQNASASKP